MRSEHRDKSVNPQLRMFVLSPIEWKAAHALRLESQGNVIIPPREIPFCPKAFSPDDEWHPVTGVRWLPPGLEIFFNLEINLNRVQSGGPKKDFVTRFLDVPTYLSFALNEYM